MRYAPLIHADSPIPRLLTAVLVAVALFVAGPASAVCTTTDQTTCVGLSLMTSTGVDAKERNEHARISETLADALGLADPPADGPYPQIRVVVENETLPVPNDTVHGTGVFSVIETFEDPTGTSQVEVYANETSGDEDSGYYRLFEDKTGVTIADVRLSVYAQAPSQTTTQVDNDTATVDQHFSEPDTAVSFTENVRIRTNDQRFALFVPHGGDIEAETSEQIDTISSKLSGIWAVKASTWETAGVWFDVSDASNHWHITSKEVSENGHPGLAALIAAPDFDAGRDFQYTASLHGMKFSKEGLLLGGRANREVKCLIASRVRERAAADGKAIPAVYIWNYDKDTSKSIDLAHGSGTKITDTAERGSNPGLSGVDTDNIVNRLSPNADGSAGFGGVQIEQSSKLRDDGYREFVAEEIAHAFGEILTKPDAIADGSTAICDALVAGDPAPTAEIRGKVWWDSDGDDAQSGTDDGVLGVELQLLNSADDVVGTTWSDAAGHYNFPGLAPGSYRVHVEVSPVFELADQDAVPGDDTLDSDPDPTTGTTAAISLAAHQIVYDVDAGLRLVAGTGRIGDWVWVDTADDGVQSTGDAGISGVQVDLFDEDGVAIATETTNAGFYQFDDLPAGDYVLRFTALRGYGTIDAGQGLDPSADSNVDAVGTASVTLASGATDLDVDAGFEIVCADATLVAFGSEWRHSTSFSADWNTVGFNDLGWSEEQASFGYGTSTAVETSITDGGSVAYFRLAFEIEDPSIIDSLKLELWHNDGAVVYLNGTAVLTSNVPVTASQEQVASETVQNPNLLTGTNVLAVEVHENDDTLLFDLEVTSPICDPCVSAETLVLDRGTYVRDDSTKKRGGEETIGMDGSTQENGLYAWNVEALPDDAEVLHAELEWVVDNASSNPFHVYPMSVAWSEAEADWFQASGTPVVAWADDGANDDAVDYDGDAPLATLRFTSSMGTTPYTGYVVLNAGGRGVVQDWIRGSVNHGLIVPGEVGSDGLDVFSDDSAQPPQLHLVVRSCSP